ncbi:hypothetical protein E4U09_000325 [Claviceps aff. purpurea]|uniref:Uncharacterized protein n=1 Tax=Claviceps aff. purpurea TaxID=1967640 RepID=A0A9P7Q938_9HYPO|nr:hypothetical protein E4U09_000325 [Claviceps aff. purpurea]
MEPKCFSELRVYWNDVSIRNSPLRPPVNFGVKVDCYRHAIELQQTCHLDEIWSLDSGDLRWETWRTVYTVNILTE